FRESPILPIPGSPNLYHELWVVIMAQHIPVFAACFIERHQAVQAPGSRWNVSQSIRMLFIVVVNLLLFGVLSMLKVFKLGVLNTSLSSRSLPSRWLSLDVSSAGCFYYDMYVAFAVVSIAGLGLCTLFVISISLHTFAVLRQVSTLSESMR
ncbi:hypothetical protein PMAYCL1PPCAC_05309, partial [Pristionchus mayeri]